MKRKDRENWAYKNLSQQQQQVRISQIHQFFIIER